MRKTLLAGAVLVLALSACNRQEPQSAAAPAATPAAKAPATPASEPRKPGHRLSAEELAAIEATGRTGLWADVDTACATGPRARTVLSWNVKASGAKQVLLLLVDKTGKERHFGRGGPVGSRQTGAWLRPGLTFKLRDLKSRAELGSVVIGKKAC